MSTHSAVEMLHDSALYKFMIDIDVDILTASKGIAKYRIPKTLKKDAKFTLKLTNTIFVPCNPF